MGKLAAKRLLELEPENAASSGELREVAKLRLKMKDKGLKKQPGYSWIDVRKKVHVFVVGDKSHRETNLTYSLHKESNIRRECPWS
ncbi:hypothetical protein ACSBR2_034116 [Camellia fascicularis]